MSDPDAVGLGEIGFLGLGVAPLGSIKMSATSEGLADLRLDLIAGIRLRSGGSAVLPACLGLHLSLPDLKIPCSRFDKRFSAENIKIAPPLKEFGLLSYLCGRCIL